MTGIAGLNQAAAMAGSQEIQKPQGEATIIGTIHRLFGEPFAEHRHNGVLLAQAPVEA